MCLLTNVLFFGFKGKLDKKAAFQSLTGFPSHPLPSQMSQDPPLGPVEGAGPGAGWCWPPLHPTPIVSCPGNRAVAKQGPAAPIAPPSQ